jgi:hypothetical protein
MRDQDGENRLSVAIIRAKREIVVVWELWDIILAVFPRWGLGMISEIFIKDAKRLMEAKRISND